MLNKDHIGAGVIIGIVLPLVLYTIFILGMDMSGRYVTNAVSEKFQLVLIAVNAIIMRQFMIKREQDKTGRGILLVTFIGVIVHVLHYYTDII
jgi:hypothetical protein